MSVRYYSVFSRDDCVFEWVRVCVCVCIMYAFGILFVSLFKSIAFKSSVTDVSIILDCMESVNPSFTFSIRYFYVNPLGDALKIAQISTRHRRTQAQQKPVGIRSGWTLHWTKIHRKIGKTRIKLLFTNYWS